MRLVIYLMGALCLAGAACSSEHGILSGSAGSSTSGGDSGSDSGSATGRTATASSGSTGSSSASSAATGAASSSGSAGLSSSGSGGAGNTTGFTPPGPVDVGPALGCDCRVPPCGCDGKANLCDAESGKCVECNGDGACPTAQLGHCGPAKTCVACASDADCGPGNSPTPRCDPGGACVACLADADCSNFAPEATVCETDPANLNFEACVPCSASEPATCAADDTSTDTYETLASLIQPGPPTCDTVRDLCTTANPLAHPYCTKDADCAMGQTNFSLPRDGVCVDGECALCSDDLQCAGVTGAWQQPTPRCDPDPDSANFRSCAQCLQQSDCNLSAGFVCVQSIEVCEPDCRKDAGAGSCGYGVVGELTGLNLCDPTSGQCVACLKDADCGAGVCDPVRHVCRPTATEPFAAGACLSSRQCSKGSVCVWTSANACGPTSPTEFWSSVAASTSSLYTASGNCACAADRDCGVGGRTCQKLNGGISGVCQ